MDSKGPDHMEPRRRTARFKSRETPTRPEPIASKIVSDEEFLRFAKTSIETARMEDPEAFDEAKNGMERAQRIAETQVKEKKMTPQQAREFIQDVHAADVVSQGVDDLTESMKRGPFVRKVNRILKRPSVKGTAHVYGDLDIDKLKDKNEHSKNKHSSADRALIGITKFHQMALIQRFGARAHLGRLSGDEFGILIENATPEEVEAFFQNSEPERQTFVEPIIREEELQTDITATRALTPALPGEDFDTVHRRTDQELIDKKAARNAAAELQTLVKQDG